MADIELLIKIPESYYKIITDKVNKTARGDGVYLGWTAIANGTPLLKGHGRLIDGSKLEQFAQLPNMTLELLAIDIFEAPTIIEADIESEDKE